VGVAKPSVEIGWAWNDGWWCWKLRAFGWYCCGYECIWFALSACWLGGAMALSNNFVISSSCFFDFSEVFSKVHKKEVKSYESTTENMLWSVCYSNGVLCEYKGVLQNTSLACLFFAKPVTNNDWRNWSFFLYWHEYLDMMFLFKVSCGAINLPRSFLPTQNLNVRTTAGYPWRSN
jgi:hypothetical protein